MLGKRFHRTTSMVQVGPCRIEPTATAEEEQRPAASDYQPISQWEILKQAEELMKQMMAAAAGGRAADDAPAEAAPVPPASSVACHSFTPSRRLCVFTPRNTFLDNCCFCKGSLKHERDIFIYRGDAAFCTEECRRRQMLKDERSSMASKAVVAA